MGRAEQYPLYGSTFTLYRASPLYHGTTQIYETLDQYAGQLRENLVGDRARGALLTDLQPEITGTGSLEQCEWSVLRDETAWVHAQQADEEPPTSAGNGAVGIQISIRFEKAKYEAYILGSPLKQSTTPGFTSLPLLLVRMPAVLRELFLDFLSRTFDARISPMKLRSPFLSSSLEGLLRHAAPEGEEDPGFDLDQLTKGLGLQLSFPAAAPHLKNMDLIIARDDIRGFLQRGRQLWQMRQQVLQAEHAWSSRPGSNITGPFTAALSVYLSNHIAMELDNPAIVVSKIAIGPFALGGEGKVKVLSSSTATVSFWKALVQEAYGDGLEGHQKARAELIEPTALDEVDLRRKDIGMRDQRMTSVPSEPPPPYELHDPTRR